MPGATRSTIGNILFEGAYYVAAVTYPTIATNAQGSNTLPFAGCLVGDILICNMQAPPAHLVLDNAYVSAPGVVTILWSTDVTGISTGTVPVLIRLARPENASQGVAALPSSVQ